MTTASRPSTVPGPGTGSDPPRLIDVDHVRFHVGNAKQAAVFYAQTFGFQIAQVSDLTTGSRFHTIEIVVSMLIKWLVILLLGPSLLAVLIFEILLNGMAIFNHANVDLPRNFDRMLRLLLVTPDMHRVHHSVRLQETNSNYGFNLSIWDRIFKTYIDQPGKGHIAMAIGIPEFRNVEQVDRLPGMLTLPFVGRP